MCPYLVIFGREIPSYGLLLSLGLVVAGAAAIGRCRRRKLEVCDLLIIAASALGLGMACAKVLYWAVSYSWEAFWQLLTRDPNALLGGGGLVFYGGLLGGIAGALVGARLAGVRLAVYEPVVIPCIPLGHAFGRIGCILAGCCYGIAYDGPFAVNYPFLAESRFPVQGLEAVCNAAIAGLLAVYARKERPDHHIGILYIMLYALARFFLEFLRGDTLRGGWGILSTSQWISLGLLAGGGLLLFVRKKIGA